MSNVNYCGLRHSTKMANMLILGQNFKTSSPEPKCQRPWALVYNTVVYGWLVIRLTLIYFTTRSNVLLNV